MIKLPSPPSRPKKPAASVVPAAPKTVSELNMRIECLHAMGGIPTIELKAFAIRYIEGFERVNTPQSKAIAAIGQHAMAQAGDSYFNLSRLVHWLGQVQLGWI